MDTKIILQNVINIIILCLVAFVIVFTTKETIIEKFFEGEDEFCEDDKYVNELKKIVIEWLDSRKKPWPPILDTLNNDKKKHIHTIQMCKGTSSYTLDKEKTYLCVLDENGNYYDKNTMMHVILHEFTHAICDEIGHTKKFDDMFVELMNEAHESTCPYQKEKIGQIYNKNEKFREDYCGLTQNDVY